MSEDRLQKILARAGYGSRRAAEELLTEGRVTVNGQVAGLGDKADPERDAIKVDGKRLHPPREHKYLLLNKPRAVMSTVADPEGRPTVIDLVPLGLRKALVPVGRLDFLTEGLLVLTDDGDFAQRVAHPRYGCTKTYEVKVRGTPDARTLDRLRRGIVIEGERTRPATIEPRPVKSDGENSWWNVELGQGRTRQIREMFQRVGHPVMKLRRVAIGPLRDPDLPPGQLRELTAREVELLRKAGKHRAKKEAAKAKAARGGAAGEGGKGGKGGKGAQGKAKRKGGKTGERSAKRVAGEAGGGDARKKTGKRKASPAGGSAGRAGGGDAAKGRGAAGRRGGKAGDGEPARRPAGRDSAARGSGAPTGGGRRAAAGRSAGTDRGRGAGGADGRRPPRRQDDEAAPVHGGSRRRPERSPDAGGGWFEWGRGGEGAATGGDRRAHRSPEGTHGRRRFSEEPGGEEATVGGERRARAGGGRAKAGGRSAGGGGKGKTGGRSAAGGGKGKTGGRSAAGGGGRSRGAGGRAGEGGGPAGRSGGGSRPRGGADRGGRGGGGRPGGSGGRGGRGGPGAGGGGSAGRSGSGGRGGSGKRGGGGRR